MNSEPRGALIKIVAEYGMPLLTAPMRFEGMLKDYGGNHRPEIAALTGCLKQGIVDQLCQQKPSAIGLACTLLAQTVEKNLSVPRETARWAVDRVGTARPARSGGRSDD
jgi:hypothetical protein